MEHCEWLVKLHVTRQGWPVKPDRGSGYLRTGVIFSGYAASCERCSVQPLIAPHRAYEAWEIRLEQAKRRANIMHGEEKLGTSVLTVPL